MYSLAVKITPKMAEEMLTHNTNNYRKNIDKSRVEQYANDMKEGRWQNNGEAISFHKDGTLANGQHRLCAIILAGVEIEMEVQYDLENDVWFFDGGKNRTERDHAFAIGLEGIDNSAYGISTRLLSETESAKRNLSKPQKTAFILKYESEIRKTVQIISCGKYSIAKKRAIGAVVFLLLHYGYDEKTARDFFKVVNSGQSESACQSAAIVIRNYILLNKGKNSNIKDMDVKLADYTMKAMKDFKNLTPRYRLYQSDGEFMAMLNQWQFEEGITHK